MPREFNRRQRVAEQIRRELAGIIREEINDPRLGMITLADIEISRDLAHAKVFFTVLGENPDTSLSMSILNKASGFLRHELGRRMVIRSIPQLHFHFDDTVERGSRLNALINVAVSDDARKSKDRKE